MTAVDGGKDQALIRFASRLAGVTKLYCLRHTVVDELGKMVPAKAWGIYELDHDGAPTHVDATLNVPDWFLEDYELGGRPTDPIYHGVCKVRAPVDSGKLLHWRRWQSEPVYEILDRVGFQRSLQAPIMCHGAVRGTLNLARDRRDPPFTATDVARLEIASGITSRVFQRVVENNTRRSEEAIAAIALDNVTEPLIVTDEFGSPLVINQVANDMVAAGGQQILPSCLRAVKENVAALRTGDGRSVEAAIEQFGERITVKTKWANTDDGRLAVSHVYRRNTATGAPPLDHSPLTPRQREIVAMVGEGLTVNEIAESVFISPNTVKQHLKRIYGVLGVHSRAELVQVLWASSGLNPAGH